MTGWLFRDVYNPLLVLLAGLATAAGCLGLGLSSLRLVRIELPAEWRIPAGMLLGIEMESLVVLLLGIAGVSTRPVLMTLWGLLVLAGAVEIGRAERDTDVPGVIGARLAALRSGWRGAGASASRVALLIVIAALGLNLLVAMAPSTKVDEIFYHMLLPSRIVTDGALRFYRYPWEAAAWPQMVFQMAAAPLHAMGLTDAPNIVSWALSATLVWFAWRTMVNGGDPAPRPLVATLVVGLYSVVWQVTGGGHAMGDLAVASAVVAVLSPDALRARVAPEAYAFAGSLFAVAAAGTKVTLLPLALVLAAWSTILAVREVRDGDRRRVLTFAFVPWLLFYVPVVAATWAYSGAPAGPLFAWIFPHSLYVAAAIHRVLDETRRQAQALPAGMPVELFARQSLAVWLAALGALVATVLPPRARIAAAALLASEVALVLWQLPWDPRFLSGIPVAFAILFARHAEPAVARRLRAPAANWAILALFVLPWLGAQAYYAFPLIGVSVGVTRVESYRERYLPFWRDNAHLDRILPPNAVIFVERFRLASVYAPRPVIWNLADLPGDSTTPLYAFGPTCEPPLPLFRTTLVVYQNPRAVVRTERTPGRRSEIGQLCVTALSRGTGDGR